MGPEIGSTLPAVLLGESQIDAIRPPAAGGPAHWRGVVVVLRDTCSRSAAVLAELAEGGRPADVGVVAVVRGRPSEGFGRDVSSVADLVVDDPIGSRCAAAGISETPVLMIVDERARVLAKSSGRDPLAALREWDANRCWGEGMGDR